MTREFWKGWKRKTKIEKTAIKVLEIGKKAIFETIPKDQIHCIYLKGSFVRREMNRKSDVDFVVILKDNKYIKKLNALHKKIRMKYEMELGIDGFSLWELERNERYHKKKVQATPSLFIIKLHKYKIIYGKELKQNDYPHGTGHTLPKRVKIFRTLFIPLFKEKKIGFSGLIKQVFWLTETELEHKKKKVPLTWKGLDKAIKEKNHIMHLAYKYRLNKPKDKKRRDAFVKKLEKHLDKLEKLY